jgi:V/A-type H+-transporting ATPase subunit A
VLDVHDVGMELVGAGVPATVLEDVDYGPLLRAKDTTGSGDAAGVTKIASELIAEMKDLAPS